MNAFFDDRVPVHSPAAYASEAHCACLVLNITEPSECLAKVWLPNNRSMRLPPPPLCLRASLGPVFPLTSKNIGLALLEPEFQDLPKLHWLSDKGWTWWLMGADTWLDLP